MRREQLVARVAADGPRLFAAHGAELAGIEVIGDVRGRGFFLGIELVANRATKEPFPTDTQLAARFGRGAVDLGGS